MSYKTVRPNAQKLYDALIMDEWPEGTAACVDFGLDGWGCNNTENANRRRLAQVRYEALYYPIRAGEITVEQLDAALGDGPVLTVLVNNCKSNPHKGVVFQTVWDYMK